MDNVDGNLRIQGQSTLHNQMLGNHTGAGFLPSCLASAALREHLFGHNVKEDAELVGRLGLTRQGSSDGNAGWERPWLAAQPRLTLHELPMFEGSTWGKGVPLLPYHSNAGELSGLWQG